MCDRCNHIPDNDEIYFIRNTDKRGAYFLKAYCNKCFKWLTGSKLERDFRNRSECSHCSCILTNDYIEVIANGSTMKMVYFSMCLDCYNNLYCLAESERDNV